VGYFYCGGFGIHLDRGFQVLLNRQRGHPLKVLSRKKTPLHEKNPFIFFAIHNAPPQHGVVFPPVSHPLFHFYWFTVQPVSIRPPEVDHPSGSRRLCFKRNTCSVQ